MTPKLNEQRQRLLEILRRHVREEDIELIDMDFHVDQ
jgi:hypothetical protein